MATSAGEAGIVRGTTNETYGYFEDLKVKKAPTTKSEQKDGVGNVVRIDYSEVPWIVSGTYVFRVKTGTQPWGAVGTGTAITFSATDLAGKNFYVDEAEMEQSMGVEGYHKCTFTATYHPNLA